MKKELIIYSLSIGINRGASILYLPLLVHALSLNDYGEFSYIQILLQLAFPFLCLNISTGIAREGADNIFKGLYIYQKTYPYVLAATLIISFTAYFFEKIINYEFLIYIILLGGVEALHNMQLNLLRVYDKHNLYAVFTISKTIGFLILIYGFIYYSSVDLRTVLIVQISWHFIVFLFFSQLFISRFNYEKIGFFVLKPVLIFSILLIPHMVSQWAMGASNRIIVKSLLGVKAMGVYSISYSLSMIMLLFNSGLAIVLPQNFIRDPLLWLSPKFKSKFFVFYTLICLGIYSFVLLFIYLNKIYFNFIEYDNYPIAFYFSILTSSFYIMGYYFYYVNILFYHKMSKWISFSTLTIAIFSIGGGYLLTKLLGIVGASLSMLLTYVLYYIVIFLLAKKIEGRLYFSLKIDVLVPVFTIITMIVLSYYFTNLVLKEFVVR
jgi:O-antigen/teichoic acid export membrane protein